MIAVDVRDKMYYEEDYLLVEEVLRCIDAQAFRSAYIVTWIAIAESLIVRFNKMSVRDKEIQKFVKDVREGKIKSVDSYILDTAKTVGLVDEVAHQKLKNILDMRNKYAHPTNIAPEKYEVLSALEIGIKEVFSQKAYIRKGYIVEQIGNFISDNTFVPNTEVSIHNFVSFLTDNVHPDNYLYIFEEIAKQLQKIIEEGANDEVLYKIVQFTDNYLQTVIGLIPDNNLEDLITKYPKAISLTISNDDILKKVSENLQFRVVNIVLEDGIQQFFSLMRISDAINKQTIKDEDLLKFYDLKVKEIVDKESYYFEYRNKSKNYKMIIPLKYYIDKVIDDLLSGDFGTQNLAVLTVFEDILKKNDDLENIDSEKLYEIGYLISGVAPDTNIMNASGSWEARNHILKLQHLGEKLNFMLIKGIFTGTLFNKVGSSQLEGYLWVKDYCFDSVLSYLIKIYSLEEIEECFRLTVSLLNQDKVQVWFGANLMDNIISIISREISNCKLTELVATLNTFEQQMQLIYKKFYQ